MTQNQLGLQGHYKYIIMNLLRSTILSTFLFFTSMITAQDFCVYVSDAGNFNNPPWQILKYDMNGENPEVFISEQLAWPQDILFLEDQQVVLITNLSSGNIARYNSDTGAFIDNFATGIGGPTRMKIGADNLLYVLQWTGNGKVKRYQLDGTFVDDFTSSGVPQSIGLDWDAAGNLYVSSYNGKIVKKFDTNGMEMGDFIDNNLAGPTNIWFTSNGQLNVFDYNGGAIKTFDSTGVFVGNFIMGLTNAEGLAFMPNGNILVGNGGTAAVKMYTADGTFIEDFVPSGSGGLLIPNAVVLREKISNAVTEFELREDLVYPTIGDTFYLQQHIDMAIQSIEVYNAAGQRIIQESKQDQVIWNAKGQATGVYHISLIAKDGLRYSQKVMVQK